MGSNPTRSTFYYEGTTALIRACSRKLSDKTLSNALDKSDRNKFFDEEMEFDVKLYICVIPRTESTCTYSATTKIAMLMSHV
jgi:hypothetical protein